MKEKLVFASMEKKRGAEVGRKKGPRKERSRKERSRKERSREI